MESISVVVRKFPETESIACIASFTNRPSSFHGPPGKDSHGSSSPSRSSPATSP